MSPRNKVFRLLDKYLARPIPTEKVTVKATTAIINGKKFKRSGTTRLSPAIRRSGVVLRQQIVAFYKSNGRWPKRTAASKYERKLGTRFENLISKECSQYDKDLRRIVMATGRKSNYKRKHAVKEGKQEIIDFINKYGRAPTNKSCNETVEGEHLLRCKLDYYTQVKNDMTLLGKVYEIDKCHLSGIPMKFRAIINEQLDVEKPLKNLV